MVLPSGPLKVTMRLARSSASTVAVTVTTLDLSTAGFFCSVGVVHATTATAPSTVNHTLNTFLMGFLLFVESSSVYERFYKLRTLTKGLLEPVYLLVPTWIALFQV
jgi:hypothetical protein